MFLDKKIAYFKQTFNDEFEALSFLSNKFVEKGVAKDSFINGVIEREKVYPTGIVLENMCVAMPHTDKEHVINNQIGFVSFEKPVEFHNMVDADNVIEVNCMFMLCIKDKQVEVIQKLMELFSSTDKMNELLKADSFDGFYKIASSLENQTK